MNCFMACNRHPLAYQPMSMVVCTKMVSLMRYIEAEGCATHFLKHRDEGSVYSLILDMLAYKSSGQKLSGTTCTNASEFVKYLWHMS
jgi:hypothetical protein